jgi:hypothetical protein
MQTLNTDNSIESLIYVFDCLLFVLSLYRLVAFYKRQCIGSLCCHSHFFFCSLSIVTDILFETPAKENRLLTNNSELTSQSMYIEVSNVYVSDGNFSFLRKVKSQKKLHNSGLSAA